MGQRATGAEARLATVGDVVAWLIDDVVSIAFVNVVSTNIAGGSVASV